MSQFEEYNIKFWTGILKCHPLFYYHRCIDWTSANTQTQIFMCPMGKLNSVWRARNDLGFLDSTSPLKSPLNDVLRPFICHNHKLIVCMACSRLEKYFTEQLSRCVFHGGLQWKTNYMKERAPDFISLRLVINR